MLNRKFSKKKSNQYQFDFDKPSLGWPPQNLFPLNLSEHQRTVKEIILQDLKNSEEYLIITGFTSLANIIEVFGNNNFENLGSTRIVIGFEPELRKRKKWERTPVEDEVKEYWLERNIDVLLGGAIINTIELIKKNKLQFRLLDHLHAKLYVGNNHAILGSANFSKQGTIFQKEANIRISNKLSQYESIKQIAENFWKESRKYDKEILSLLEELLQNVPWDQSLARAIAEILEGNWLSEYPVLKEKFDTANLWPFQKSGLAKTLHLLEVQGSILVADPTGSGKTRMITTSILALIHRLWNIGRRDHTNTLVLCPKAVIENWQNESREVSFLNNAQISMGILQVEGRNRGKAIKDLQIANILVMDEAHNFLSKKTNRSQAINEHSASYVILSTATPINKKAEDLIRLIELLGPDNLNDDELKELKNFYKNHIYETSQEDLHRLSEYIRKFILRRTKKELNKQIELTPELYKDKKGYYAKFPEVRNHVYPTKQSNEDVIIANKINKYAEELNGLIYLRRFNLPPYIDKHEIEKVKQYVKGRLNAAKAFAAYQIRNAMRSSRVALVEHIIGTREAKEWQEIKGTKPNSGNTIEKLLSFKDKGIPSFEFDKNFLPQWLTREDLYRKEIEEEKEKYNSILDLVKKMSDMRERSKVEQIIKLYDKYGMVLAFDSTVITLFYLRQILSENSNLKILVVSGSDSAERDSVLEIFGVDSAATNVIALCSDAMSEGVNLQRAEALIQLDMPSVLRLAEQRVGRLHRMDNPHKTVHVFWPDDIEEFALKSDRRLVTTSILTDKLIGSNLQLPDEFISREMEVIRAKDIIKEFKPFEEEDIKWEGLHDAFQPVYDLIEGDSAIISADVYDELKKTKATVRCRVSFVNSKNDWAFICLRGNDKNSPLWLLIESSGSIYTDFNIISNLLRDRLKEVRNIDWNQDTLEKFVKILKQNEKEALPNKKRRALEVSEFLLRRQLKIEIDNKNKQLIKRLLQAFNRNINEDDVSIDYNRFADQWLDLIMPLLKGRQLKQKRRSLITLEDLKVKRNKKYFNINDLLRIYNYIPLTDKLEQRIAACILGVGNK